MSATPQTFDQVLASTYVNLADERVGTQIVSVTDEFFAPAVRMLDPKPAVFHPGKFDDHGQYMEGWESRRKRVAAGTKLDDVEEVRKFLSSRVAFFKVPKYIKIIESFAPFTTPTGKVQKFKLTETMAKELPVSSSS
ncbi:unnamed protein product [Adineta steineri]|uniref:Allantoate amidinohydrolase n=1 Tax=Adineta steineri TaxID=433720 RepID=A0A814U066_9BILA|nr:unnamed protein product [Adineta steineri]